MKNPNSKKRKNEKSKLTHTDQPSAGVAVGGFQPARFVGDTCLSEFLLTGSHFCLPAINLYNFQPTG